MKKALDKRAKKAVREAAQACIDEYRDNLMQAVELIIKQSEVSTGKWPLVATLFLNLRVNPLGFEVAIKDATHAKLLDAGFRVFGCSICGSRRWRANGTDCKPCRERFQKAMAAKGPKTYVVANP